MSYLQDCGCRVDFPIHLFWSWVLMAAVLWGFAIQLKWLLKETGTDLSLCQGQSWQATGQIHYQRWAAATAVVDFGFVWLLYLHYCCHKSNLLQPCAWFNVYCPPYDVSQWRGQPSSPPVSDQTLILTCSSLWSRFMWYLKHSMACTNTVYALLCCFMCENWGTSSECL